ncbi:ATP-binding cassette domain-containing protein [Vagococcus fluvialis]|jgi:ABC-2 type transport system ATP-binding protein|uniref:ABC transporter ATP-binding protein n=1 Tax=Vagococcus fluvialis TaxID=2738 RepID=UPI003D0F2EBA
MTKMMTINKLNKKFNQKEILKDLSFDINQGEILCFLGPNGAGKSTTINILSGVLPYGSGEVNFFGEDINKNKSNYQSQLGIVPQEIALYEDLSAEENVRFFASLYGLKGEVLKESVKRALKRVGLLERKKDKPKTFSGGMKRRLNIACAIAHEPKLLIMDEPTVGIDPQSRNHILESIKEMKQQGMTILYSTHYMEEVEQIADRLLILDLGQKIVEGPIEEIKQKHDKQIQINLEDNQLVNKETFYEVLGVKEVSFSDNQLLITSLTSINNMDQIMTELINQQLHLKNMTVIENNLESIFLELTGRTLRD